VTAGTSDRLRHTAGPASLELSPADGGRISSFAIDGRELLKTEGYGAIAWGAFPMVPFAGRIRDGRFTFRGRDIQLPLNRAPHAIHGTGFERPWQIRDDATLTFELGDPWPFRGRVVQHVDLSPDALRVSLELVADEPMPAALGWHPWFRRRLAPDEADLELDFEAASMLERAPDGIPSGALVAPKARPWDDCFTGVRPDPTLRWPGLELAIASSAAFWVVYDEEPDAICVEPQTAPPDAANQAPTIVEPGEPLGAVMEWRWRTR
jgi:aldose 1-epimerase